ncbi:T9SS type B sorting domain-containing protein [Winogradskyella sp. PG-2]|uniref:T9SS type B sorting domain-containing protein n=1 Tax=Winogradskyella sp. PG-2 TaxID=754409 RepID=UPI0006988787|nr:choice-of-anchor L domain-containing protein [Winogradskyella sp. PG-2]
MIDNLTNGSCVIAENATSNINGTINGITSYGLFNRGTSDFPLENGIVLSTGNITSAGNTTQFLSLNDGNIDWETDSDIESILGINQTLNTTSLEFDFTSTNNSVGFKYIFASDEYQQQYACNFRDVFAILIKEVGSADPYVNIALIPDTNIPVTTSSIHPEIVNGCDAENDSFFEGYNLPATNFDGQTVVLNASTDITPGVTYHVKFIIADHIDQRFDSAVFIESDSFGNTVDLGPDVTACGSSVVLDGTVTMPNASYTWFKDDIEIVGATSPLFDVTESGTYEIVVTIQLPNGTCSFSDSVIINTVPFQQAVPISDLVICDEPPADGIVFFDLTTKNDEIYDALPSTDYVISYHRSEDDAFNNIAPIIGDYQNTDSSETLYVRIESLDGSCLQIGNFNVEIGAKPNFIIIPPIILCSQFLIDGVGYLELSYYAFEIANYEFNRTVTYHTTEQDANDGVDSITFASEMPFGSTYTYVRIVNDFTGCFIVVPIQIIILDRLDFNQRFFIDLCLDSGESTAIFDLEIIVNEVLEEYPDANVSFYTSIQDAEDEAFPIFPGYLYQNETPFQQTVYMNVKNLNQPCPTLAEVDLHTNLTRNVIGDQPLVQKCDDISGDGILDFDLMEVAEEIKDGYDIDVTFFNTVEDRSNGINTIDLGIPYTVTNSEGIIYATVSSNNCDYYTEVTLRVNPLPILAPQVIDYCGNPNAEEGYTSILIGPLKNIVSEGLSDTSIAFYENEADAISDENELFVTYNATSSSPILYARVINGRTQCYSITTVQVNISDELAIATPDPIVVCEYDYDDTAIVNLESVLPQLSDDLSNVTVSFHENFRHAVLSISPITNTQNYTTQSTELYIRVALENLDCFVVVPLDIQIYEDPILNSISDYINCETEPNLTSEFYFINKDIEVINGQSGMEVLYFETEIDANNREYSIDKNAPYLASSNPQTIYVRLENEAGNSCYKVAPMQIEVRQAPLYNEPTDIFECDYNGNQLNTVDFNEKIDEITNGVSQDLNVTFHLTPLNADISTNALPLNYTTTVNPQLIYARVENLASGCHSVATFNITTLALPEVNYGQSLINCANNYEFEQEWNLTDVELLILEGRQYGVEFSYYESVEDLQNNTNEILNFENYTNTSNPQTIFAKVLNVSTTCFSSVPFSLILNGPPVINDIETFNTCDTLDNSINLLDINDALFENTFNVLISYHTSETDAEANINPLNTNYSYTNAIETLYVRAEYSTTHCYAVYPFTLNVNPLPIANQPNDLIACDDDFDGFVQFDLSLQNGAVLNGQNSNDYTITYHNSEIDAIENNEAIDNEYLAYNSETIFVRLTNNETSCYDFTQFSVVINPLPFVSIEEQVVCLNNLPLVVSADTNNPLDSYLWSTNAATSEIEIFQTGTYSVTITNEFGCESTSTFNVTESESAEIDVIETIDFSDPNNITVTVNGIGNYLYQLNDGPLQSSNIFVNVPIGYNTITIIDQNGCDRITRDVLVIDTPKHLSPNDDGDFDTWHITGVETLTGTVIHIFDRYGKLLKELGHNTSGWDGTFNGNEMPAGDYWYIANVIQNGESFQVKGHFALRR